MDKPFILIISIILIFFLIATTGQALHQALQADSAENYVVIGPVPDLDIPSVSIECWVNLMTLPKEAGAHFVWNGDERPGNESYTLGVDWKGKVMAVGNFNGGFNFRSKIILELNRWTHIALAIDDKSKRVRLYIDGELDAEASYRNTLPVGYSFLTFGAGFDGRTVYNQPYLGLLDEVRIFDYARTPTEIKTTMHTALVGNEPGLVGYWRFDEPEDEFTASDSSEHANHGNLFGDEAFVESDLPMSYLRGEINTVDGWQVVLANHSAKLILTLTIIGTSDSPDVTDINVTLPEKLSTNTQLNGAVTYDGNAVPATAFHAGRVLTIQLEEGISTGRIEIPFMVESGQTEAQGLTFAVTLKGDSSRTRKSSGTIIAEDVPAGDANGNSADTNSFSGITLISDEPLPPLRNVKVTPVHGENDLVIRWTPAEDMRVRKYDIYANDEKIAEITGQKKANYIHQNLTPGAKFSYSVQAVAASILKSPPSEPITATVGVDTTPPPPPTDVKVERLQPKLVRVSWTKPAPDAARYDIARAESDDGVHLHLAELTADEMEYIDETPRAYRYVVRAWDEQDNEGGWSEPARLRVSETPTTPEFLGIRLQAARTLLWAILGPFDKGKAPNIETLAAPMGTYVGMEGKEVNWFELPLDEYDVVRGLNPKLFGGSTPEQLNPRTTEIDWGTVLKADDGCEAYAVTYLDSPKPQQAKFEVHQERGSQTLLILNGMYLKRTPDTSGFIGKLRPGRNKLLMHLTHDEGDWRGTFRILAQGGQLLKELTSVSPFDAPFQPSITVPLPRPWGPEQMTGPPDTMRYGDIETAYCPLKANEGLVWLFLTYATPMHARQVRIYETYGPGTVAKVELYDEESGEPHTVWEGVAPKTKSPSTFDVVFPQTAYRVVGVKITLDISRVRGWNEIDAVQLVGAEGEQWARWAIASSFWDSIWDMQNYLQQANVLSVAELVEHLRFDGTPNTRRQSAQRLRSQLKDAAIPFLKDALSDPDASVRVTVIQELAKLKSEAAVDILLGHLENHADSLSEIELQAIFDGLCSLANSKAIAPLLAWAARTKLPTERIGPLYVAIALYEKAGEWETADALIRVVRGLNPRTTHLFEAENYEQATGPFQSVEASNTWGGKYLCIPDTLDCSGDEVGEAQYQFDVSEAGEYMVIARVMASHQHADSFFISIDEMEPHRWDIKPQKPRWVWNSPTVEQDGGNGPLLFHLDAGGHTLRLGNGEDGTKIDRLVIHRLQLDVPALAELLKAENPRLRREAIRLLAHLKDKRAVMPLRHALKSDDANIRLTALRSLTSLNDIDGLIETLSHNDVQMRREAVIALKRLGDERAVEPLCDKLKDSDKEVRYEVLFALESLRDKRAVEPLIEHLDTVGDEEEAIDTAVVLGAFGNPEAMDAVAPLLYRRNAADRIAHILGELHNHDAVDLLMDFLYNPKASVRFEVAVALGRLRAVDIIDDLRDLMKNDPNPHVRLGAADALYCLGDADGLSALRQAGALIGTGWHLLGPFGLVGQAACLPEKEIDLTKTYSGKSAPIRWQKLKEREMGLLIDPRMFLTSGSDAVVYAVTAVDAPSARKAELRVRNDADMKVWLNGVLVSSHAYYWRINPKRISLQLKQGRNVILVKVQNPAATWYFQACLSDENGKGFPDVTYAVPIESPLAFSTTTPPEGEPLTSDFSLHLPTVESPDYRMNVYASGMPTLTALAFAPDGMLYAASKEAGRIYQIRPDTSWSEFAEVPNPTDLTCASDGTLYVTSGPGKKSGVFNISAEGEKKLVTDGFVVPAAIEMAPDGTLFVADSFAGRISAVTDDGNITHRVEGLASPLGPNCLAFAPDGTLYFVERETDRLFSLKRDGERTAIDWNAEKPLLPLFEGSTLEQRAEVARIAFDTEGILFATVPSTGQLLVRDSGGQLSVVVRGLSQPSGIAIDPSGAIFVTNKSQILKLTK